jgi:hypothetical protein
MNEPGTSLIFNSNPPNDLPAADKAAQETATAADAQDAPKQPAVYISPEDPVVQLDLDAGNPKAHVARVERQSQKLRDLKLTAQAQDPFDMPPDWAYRCYAVTSPQGDRVLRSHICLFNVVVALEWHPDTA